MGSHKPISRIAIIGAGPSGLAAAKYEASCAEYHWRANEHLTLLGIYWQNTFLRR